MADPNIPAYDASILHELDSDSLIHDPLFLLESQRQTTLRHFRRYKKLLRRFPSADGPDREADLRMAQARVQSAVRRLSQMLTRSTEEMVQWRRRWRILLGWISVPLLAAKIWIIKRHSERNDHSSMLIAAMVTAAVTFQSIRREVAPSITRSLCRDLAGLEKDLEDNYNLSGLETEGENFLRGGNWKALSYL